MQKVFDLVLKKVEETDPTVPSSSSAVPPSDDPANKAGVDVMMRALKRADANNALEGLVMEESLKIDGADQAFEDDPELAFALAASLEAAPQPSMQGSPCSAIGEEDAAN